MSENQGKPKNRLKKIVIGIFILLVPVMVSVLILHEIYKSPWDNFKNVAVEKLNQGYDLVCAANDGLQLCLMNHTKDNMLGFHKDNISIEYYNNPCLNVYLTATNRSSGITKTNDHFGITNDTDKACSYALQFRTIDGWHFGKVTDQAGFTNDTNQNLYYAGKSLSCGFGTKLVNGTCIFDAFYGN